MFSLQIERCIFHVIAISYPLELSIWCSCLWSFVVMRHCMLAHCNNVLFVLLSVSVCSLKVLASVFLLSGIPVWVGIQLIVGLCDNLDAASMMALVIVFKSSFLLFSMFTYVKECIVILSLVLLELWLSFPHPVLLTCVQLPPPPMSRHLNRRNVRNVVWLRTDIL